MSSASNPKEEHAAMMPYRMYFSVQTLAHRRPKARGWLGRCRPRGSTTQEALAFPQMNFSLEGVGRRHLR